MTERNTGGPAFPAMHFDLTDNEHGMTLRDYFAAQALTGICANSGNTALKSAEQFAQAAYNVADAMLEARK